MEADVEYLTEWPPPSNSQGVISQTVTSSKMAPGKNKRSALEREQVKRIKYDETETKIKPNHPDNLPLMDMTLLTSDPTVMPDVLLSRWWKKSNKSITLPDSCCNPRTLLYHITRLPEGQAILTHRISYLQEKLSNLRSSSEYVWQVHYNLASCYHMLEPELNSVELALLHAKKALSKLELQGREPEVEWLVEQLVRQKDAEEKKLQMEKVLLNRTGSCMPKPIQVDRRCAKELSLSEFIKHYALTHTPVVITGLVGHMTSTPWTLDYMKERIGHKIAPLKRMVEGSVEWARLETAGECIVKEFIDTLDTAKNLRYLFDWSLPLYSPELAAELSIPKYFANDFLQRTPDGSLYHDSWPSLFIAPAGITSELHVDAFGSNFWMALFEGTKRWVFFPPEDTPLLYPIYSNSTDAVFQATLSSPNFSLHPLLALTHPRECTLTPGEVLYVPAGCPHRVENLEKSLAISANFVDCSNFDLVKRELGANASVDECAKQLLTVLENDGFDMRMRGLDNTIETESMNQLADKTLVLRNHQQSGKESTSPKQKVCRTVVRQSLCIPWSQFKGPIKAL